MTRLTLFKSSLQTSYQTPVASPFLTTVFDGISLCFRLFTPEAEVQQVHDKNKVESGLILCFRMQIMFRPSFSTVATLLHLIPDQLSGGSSTTSIDIHIDTIVIDKLGMAKNFCIGSNVV